MKKITLLSLGLVFIMTPLAASAARLTADLAGVVPQVGNTVLVPIVLDTEGESVNAVEGTMVLTLGGVADVVDISTAGSAFALWPRTPSLSVEGDRVSFTGGVPRGVKGERHLVFSLVVRIEEVGSVTIGPADVFVYRHDGQGTRLAATFASTTIMSEPRSSDAPTDMWSVLTAQDRTSPKSFEVVLGQDPAIFDGQWFVAFSTQDDQSGVAYYEVIEGDRAPVRATGEYVLQNQDAPERIVVRAYDRAGNVRESVWKPSGYSTMMLWLGLVLLAVLLGVGWYRFGRVRSL